MVRGGRSLGIDVLAGLLVGLVIGGLGGRLVMRLIAVVAGPSVTGQVTANGNIIGEITAGGTLALVLFSGVASGLLSGLLHAAARPSLPPSGARRALAFGLLLLAMLGYNVIDPENPDFRRFGSPLVNIGLFAALAVIFGGLVAWLSIRLQRALAPGDGRWQRAVPRFALQGGVAAALALGVLVIAMFVSSAVLTLAGVQAPIPIRDLGTANSVVILLALGAACVARLPLAPAAGRVAFAIPALAGSWLIATSIVRILGIMGISG